MPKPHRALSGMGRVLIPLAGLGTVVASLSLGSPATMSWRPKAERYQPNTPYYQGHGQRDRRSNPIPVLELTLSHGVSLLLLSHTPSA